MMKNKSIDIVKKNYQGKEVFRYRGQVVHCTSKGVMLRAVFGIEKVAVQADLIFQRGDHFIEFYPFDRWFNIYQVHQGNSSDIKAWYCNISRPAVLQDGELFFEDLELDLLVYPNGDQFVLDQQEFEEMRIDPQEKQAALQAMQELQVLFSDLDALELAEKVIR